MKFADILGSNTPNRTMLDKLISEASSYGEKYAATYNPQLFMHSSDQLKLSTTRAETNKKTMLANKPNAVLWTSTAIKEQDGYSSDWVEWCKSEMPQWVSKTGFLLQVKSGAKILRMNTTRDARRVFEAIKLAYPKELNYELDLKYGGMSLLRYPWNLISKEFDAIHCSDPHVDRYGFMYSWDCESTAWLTSNFLTSVGKVQISSK